MITFVVTQAEADAIPGPKQLWIDLPRGIYVRTGVDIQTEDPTITANNTEGNAIRGLIAALTAGTATNLQVQRVLAWLLKNRQ